MAGIIWTKFFWSDWDTDPALRLCSFAAQGLWMRMLCIAAAHDPIGYVAVAGRALDETSIARMTGGEESEVRALLGELNRNGVFSRDRQGRIYSRRMVGDARKAAQARKNGKKGGNPNLGNNSENSASDNPPDNARVKPQEPEAKSQEREGTSPSLSGERGAPAEKGRKSDGKIPSGFPDDEAISEAVAIIRQRGVELDVRRQAERFRNHAEANGRRLHDWGAGWRNWIDIACDDAPSSPQSGAKPTHALWAGPAEVRAAIVADPAGGEAFARGFLDPCGWRNGPERVITSNNSYRLDRIRNSVGHVLKDFNVRTSLEGAQ